MFNGLKGYSIRYCSSRKNAYSMLIARDYSRKSGAKVLLFLHICKKKCEKVAMFQRLKLFFEGSMPLKGRWGVRDEWNNSLCMSGGR